MFALKTPDSFLAVLSSVLFAGLLMRPQNVEAKAEDEAIKYDAKASLSNLQQSDQHVPQYSQNLMVNFIKLTRRK